MKPNFDDNPADALWLSGSLAVCIETYGCQMNVADSMLIRGTLEQAGHRLVEDLNQADLIILNTCSVRENAETKIFARLKHLLSWKRKDPQRRIAVCGCLATHRRESLCSRAPWVDLLIGPDSYRDLPALVAASRDHSPITSVALNHRETYAEMPAPKVDPPLGWLPIQRGCDRFCSFCIVPYVRGRERSSPPQQILQQARELISAGAKEITLLGQTVNSYNCDDVDLADILEDISAIEGIERLRFTSPYPLDFSQKLIRTLAKSPKVMPHVHLPVQSGSDSVLERMNRGYRRADAERIIRDLRRAEPRLALSTDLIVGFPGESEQDFQATLDLVAAQRFDSAFMFLYSQRSGTIASRKLPDDVPPAEKTARLERLIALQEEIGREINEELLGSIVEVLVLGPSKRDTDQLMGKTDTFKTTVFSTPPTKKPTPGELVSVRISRTTSHTLIGDLVCTEKSDVID